MTKRSIAFAALAALSIALAVSAANAPPSPQNGKCPAGWRFQTTVAARDAHTGLATGKRMHKPYTVAARSGAPSSGSAGQGGITTPDAWDGKTVAAPPPSQGSCVPAS